MDRQKTSFTFKLPKDQQETLIVILSGGNYRPVEAQHSIIAVEGDNCRIVLYKSGKCLVQGKGSADFISFVLEPLVLQEVRLGYEDILDPKASAAHMGVDESGKGDFFGPMVTASAYIDPELAEKMREMDVKDSKNITSDKKALGMARDLRKLLGRRFGLVMIGPSAYNRLYSKMRNVNSILAWSHARAIENLLEIVPGCPRAISDQFGNKSSVEKALMSKGQKIKLEQRHKAESDMAVAAASIIARGAFLQALQKMGKQFSTTIPKGASAAVQEAAVELVKEHGPKILLETSKCHFKTADKVLDKAGFKRADLGPEGAHTSKAVDFSKYKKRS